MSESTPDWKTIDEMLAAAIGTLSTELWDGAMGGSGRETTLHRNAAAFDEIKLKPRVLTGVASADLRTSFAGLDLAHPVMAAPVGEIALFHPRGAAALAEATARSGTAAFIGAVSSPSLEEVRAAGTGPLIFQLYMFGDLAWMKRLVARAEAAGYEAICLTVDTPVSGRLERDLRNRLTLPPRPRPNFEGPYEPGSYSGGLLTWADVARLREATRLPLILKGILSPEDAALAVLHGIDVVCVSNHGGRQLEGAPASIEALPEIVREVAGKAEVIVDGGIRSGVDVVRALALGARAVLVGKLMVLALAAGGCAGVVRMLDLLTDEVAVTMVNLGVAGVGDLGRQHLWLPAPQQYGRHE